VDQKANLLFTALPPGGEVADEGRQLAAVMLRRLLSTDFEEFFGKLPEEQKVAFKAQMLALLQGEPNAQMRRKLVDLVAEASRNLMDDDGNNLWPEFLKFLFDLAGSPPSEHKEIALLLFRYFTFSVLSAVARALLFTDSCRACAFVFCFNFWPLLVIFCIRDKK
jgi:hypothetical protein